MRYAAFLNQKDDLKLLLPSCLLRAILNVFRMYLLQTCVNSREDAQKALVELERLEQTLKNEVFEPKSKP
jgi:hypothetical protein